MPSCDIGLVPPALPGGRFLVIKGVDVASDPPHTVATVN